MAEQDSEPGRSPGLLASAQQLLSTLLEILQTRVEIVSTEFEEERVRLQDVVVFGILTMFFIGIGIILVTLFIVMLYWDSNPLAVLGGIAALYLVLGGLTGRVLYLRLKSRPRLFATTLSELEKDREQLRTRS